MKITEHLRKNEALYRRLLPLLACLFGVAATAMILTPAFIGTGKILGTRYFFMGFEAAFGLSETVGKATLTVLAPNLLSILCFLLPIPAVALCILSLIPRLSKHARLFTLIGAALFLLCAFLAFLSLIPFASTIVGREFSGLYTWSYGAGTVLCAAFSLVSSVCLAAKYAIL